MRYRELDIYWKKIFDLEWISLCEGSKAIAALIVSDAERFFCIQQKGSHSSKRTYLGRTV